MPLVKRSNIRPMKGGTSPPAVVLPMEYTEPAADFNFMNIFIHGEKKVGKTSLAQQLDDEGGKVLFLQFDPPQKAYRRIEEAFVLKPWSHFMAYLKALEAADAKGTMPYRRVVVDGVSSWYGKCMEHVCSKLAIEHPGDEAYGKGWSALKVEFTKACDRLLSLSCGVWFLAHSGWKEVETRDEGVKVQKLLPILTGSCEEILNGKVDGWFAYDYVEKRRVLFIEGNERVGAGHRMHDAENGSAHFRVGGEDGPAVREIDMGKSPREAYDNLIRAFNNQQTYADVDDMVEGGGKVKVKTRRKA